MKEIKVINCSNCPFSYDEYDDFAIGNNTIEICTLSSFYHLDDSIIDIYDMHDDEKITDTPKWCPLKKDSFNIKM